MSISYWLSTPFNPQTDSQTEWQNQIMGQYLWAFGNFKQEYWAVLLPQVEFTYNNSVHASTRMASIWAMYHQNPKMQIKPQTASHLESENEVDTTLKEFAETRWTLRENILKVQHQHTMYTGGKENMFNIGYKVRLSTKHFQITRQSKKLNYKCTELYTVSWVINTNSYTLNQPKTIWNNNVFRVLQLDRYTLPV